MKKKILFIPSLMSGGTYYYRVYTPMRELSLLYPDEFDITISNDFTFDDLEKDKIGKSYDIVCFHQCLFAGEIQDKVWEMIIYCKKTYGTKFVLDIDDYWLYHTKHPSYNGCIFNAYPQKMMINFKMFDYVTTTTEYFKQEISKFFDKDKIFVFENGISEDDNQFSQKKTKSDKIRIGLTGGSSHAEDIKQIMGMSKYLTDKQLDEIEFILCGYDTKNAKRYEIDENGKVVSEHDMDDNDNWWVKIDKTFNSQFKHYRHIGAKDLVKGDFGHIYEDIDILLVPLVNNKFNRCKSELKFIEAGFTGTMVICSNTIPYSNFGQDMRDCIIVKDPQPCKWAKAIKKVLRNRELLSSLSNNNAQNVISTRNLAEITQRRRNFFNKIS